MARKDGRRILEAVRSRIWKIAFRNFAIACNGKAEEIFKGAGSRAGDKADQVAKVAAVVVSAAAPE